MSPIISTFFGIIVRLQFELGGKHHLPHVHADINDKIRMQVNDHIRMYKLV